MISELSEEEILNFLMTSDFNDDFSPEELKYLLIKWRNFYRILYGNMERDKNENEGNISNLNLQLSDLKSQIVTLQVDILQRDSNIEELKNRKLSIKERITGKIIINKNENTRIQST